MRVASLIVAELSILYVSWEDGRLWGDYRRVLHVAMPLTRNYAAEQSVEGHPPALFNQVLRLAWKVSFPAV